MKRGFTLLELLISCALLLAILGILATTINRAHQIRQEATRRTTLLTQGRAVLDFIANDLQSIIATNLDIIGEQGYRDYPAFTNTLHFTKTITLADTDPGSATNALPAERVRYFVATNDYPAPFQGYALYRQTGAWSNRAGTASAVVGQRAEMDETTSGGSYTVTNIVAGPGTTRLPPAMAGETILVPVNSSSTSRVYDWDTSTAAWLDVVPADDAGLTNQINATVVFTASYAHLSTNIIERPPTNTVVWPDAPVTTVSTGCQFLVQQTVAGIAFAAGEYTNTLTSTSFGARDWIRLTGTNVQQVVSTNELTAAVETNQVTTVWTNDLSLASWTGCWVTVQSDLPSVTTTPVRVAWATTNLPALFFNNYWTWVDSPDTTNRLDALADRQMNETLHAWQLAVDPVVDLTNFPWRLSFALTNTFVFPPPGASNNVPPIPAIPLELDAVEVIEGAGNSSDWATLSRTWQTATGTMPVPPFQSQTRHQQTMTSITNHITGTNMISVILETTTLVITNRLTAWVPAGVIATNRYAYETTTRDGDWIESDRDTDTTWVPVVLQNDFEGADVEIHSLWLDASERAGHTFDYKFGDIHDLVGERAGDDDKEPPMTDPRLLLDGVAACYFQPLAFKVESGEPQLGPWSPGDTEPPVCIDIYLELIDPAIGRRAATMPDADTRHSFVRRHVVRLTKRVPLQTHNRWRAP